MGWGRVWCMPERGKIQDVYLHPNRNAKEISRELNMDKGLLSRILKKLEAKGYIYREKAANDNRMEFVKLTKHGEEVYHTLNMAANRSVEEIFAGLDESRLQEIVKSMENIFSLMTNNK